MVTKVINYSSILYLTYRFFEEIINRNENAKFYPIDKLCIGITTFSILSNCYLSYIKYKYNYNK